jgi:uncharacterized protein (DUF302 family)
MHRRDNPNRPKTRGRACRALVTTVSASGIVALAAALVAPVSASAKTLPAAHGKAQAQAGTVDVPFLTATTPKSFSSAVSSLKTAVSSAGMMVLGQLNQAGALSVTGLHLKGAETFFVGNPTVGKKLFAMDPAIGAVIPVRMYVFVNNAGKTEVGYLGPVKLAAAVDVPLAKPAAMIAKVADKVVQKVTGTTPKPAGVVRSLQFVTEPSAKPFGPTVSAFKTAVSSAGMMVLGQLNQAGALSVTGLHLKGAETFFVGNPTVGKKLFAMDTAIGMEIPMGFYLWASPSGKTEVGYFAPAPVFKAVSPKLAGKGPMFAQIASKIAHAAA